MTRIGWVMACACLVVPSAAGARPPISHDAYGKNPGDRHLEFRLGAGLLSGDTTYSIGGSLADNRGYSGEIRDPLSELKWPLDVVLVTLGVRARLGDFSVRGGISKNATSDPGYLEDSDWGVFYLLSDGDPHFDPASKDIFSTSSTSLDALILEVGGRYELWRRGGFATAVGLGLRHQKFTITGSDVHQYSPTWADYGLPEDPFAGAAAGRVIEYEVRYTIPFAELAGSHRFGRMLSLEGSVGYSPRVTARDRDDHLLRSKLGSGSGRGQAWLFDLALRCQATGHWFGVLGASGLFIRTSGTQRQEFYAGDSVGVELTIDQKITSFQISGTLELGYGF